MNGRLEHKIINEKIIEEKLKELPKYVGDYYLSRASSKESKGSLEYIRKIKNFLEFLNKDKSFKDNERQILYEEYE